MRLTVVIVKPKEGMMKGKTKVKTNRRKKSKVRRMKPAEMQSLRKIMQVVPGKGWEAICRFPGSPLIRVPMSGWALVEEINPRMSLVAGVIEGTQLWDEQPECIGYAHQSEPMEQLIARSARPTAHKGPLVEAIAPIRIMRLAGMLSNSVYSTFKGTPEVESMPPEMIADKVNNMDLPDENRRIVAILPATDAHAFYSFGVDLTVQRPLSVWALVREADGSYTVAGMDTEHFLCDEWTNFIGYDPQPPQVKEFQWAD
jgi:hypothetical protein